MPTSSHPQAKFDPIPPDLDLSALVEKTPNFDYVIRITSDQIQDLGLGEFEKLVLLHVIKGGKPLVIEGWHNKLPPWLFSPAWLEDNVGRKQENVRDIGNSEDMPMTIGHYLGAMQQLTKQWTPANFREPKRQRLYLKDIDCPEAWHQHLKGVMPQILFYLNECTGERGGPGAVHEHNSYNQLVLGNGVGPAGDLMSSLPPEMRAENLMCYIGHEGTYTPTHREMCASLGQNIMVETSTTATGEKPGCSIWFMTETKDREVVSEYFLSMLGHDIEVESHFAQINAWKKAPFPVYILEQKVGDFVLIPPLAPHQVWNRGNRTMKVAWNRTTVETLELALHEALPRARMVCRDEQYKNKAIIFYTLDKYYAQLKRIEQAEEASGEGQAKEFTRNGTRVKQLKKDFRRLFALYTEILVSEMFSSGMPKEKNVEFLPFDSNVTCSYCRCNIFNRFLTCKTCIGTVEGTGDEDAYDVCMECYAMGRSCGCISNLKWVEQWQWSDLTLRYEDWRAMVIENDGFIDIDASPQKLDVVRLRYGKKPIAEVCQEQLKRRPWRDATKPLEGAPSPRESESEPEVNKEGYAKKRKPARRRVQQLSKNAKACHICYHRDWNWKLAFCTTCISSYCYGTLWRAFDLKPQTVMENPNWRCPKCLKICSCAKCRRDASQHPYRPKGTLLGHDTKCVADLRSVESLVDFSRTNLLWLRNEGDEDPQVSQRMQKLVEKAQTEKALDEALGDEHSLDENGVQLANQNHIDADAEDNMAIDPQLRDSELMVDTSIRDVATRHNGSHDMAYSSVDRNGRADAESGTRHSFGFNDMIRYPSTHDNSFGAYVPPEANMFISDEPLYPNPSSPGRDRMMGMGYYQQANDADKILFHLPELATPTEECPDLSYPKLPQQPENDYQQGNMHDGYGTTEGAELDPARAQFFEAQRKQKLALARKTGTYFMTQNQLEGGQSLTVKLPVSKSNFLQDMRDLDEARPLRKENHRKPRKQTPRHGQSSPEEGTSGIVPDTQDRLEGNTVQSVRQENAADQEDSVDLATRALKMLNVPIAALESAAETRLSKLTKKRSRSQGSQEGVKNLIDEDRPSSSPIPIVYSEETAKSEASPKPLVITAIKMLPNTNNNTNTKEAGAEPHEKLVEKLNSDNSISPAAEEESFAFVDGDPKPASPLPDRTTNATKLGTKMSISEEYLLAKEQALRMVEGEMDLDTSSDDSQDEVQTDLRILHHSKADNASSKAKAIHKTITSNLKPPATQYLSMAERQALKGKPFKIVPKRHSSIKPTNRPNAIATSKPSITKAKVVVRVDRAKVSEDSPTEDSSSEDDDSIPAVLPVAKKPRIESLRGY